jgi:hypothetical protein
MRLLQLTLAILLVAIGAPTAAMRARELISRKSRRQTDPGERHRAWLSFHTAVLWISLGLFQIFPRPRWDHDPWLLAQTCYMTALVVWLITPCIRRAWSRHRRTPPRDDRALSSGPDGAARSDLFARLDELKARRDRLNAEQARWDADFTELKADVERYEHAMGALKSDARADQEHDTAPQANVKEADGI